MSRFSRILKVAEDIGTGAKKTAAKKTAAEFVEGGIKPKGGKPKSLTKAQLASQVEELQKKLAELEAAGSKAASTSTPPASVRTSLGAPRLMREAQERKTAAKFVGEGMPGRKLTMKEAESKSEVARRAGQTYRNLNKGADPDADNFFSKEGLGNVTEHTGDSHPALWGAMRRERTPQAEHQGRLLRARYRGLKGGQGAEVNAHIIDALKIIEEKPEVFRNVYNALSPKMQIFLDDHFLPHLGKILNTLKAGGELNPTMKRALAEIAYKLGIATTAGVAATKGYKSASSEEA